MSKATIIMAMFLGLVMFYILYVVNKTAKDVNKLESFQNSVVVTKVVEEAPVEKVVEIKKDPVVVAPKEEPKKEPKDVDAETPEADVAEQPIKNDKERYYFIGKQLFEMEPENGASQFFDEVEALSEKYQSLTQAEIKKKLAVYIKERAKPEAVSIDKTTRDEIYGITDRMVEVTDKIKKQSVGNPGSKQQSVVVENFVQPSSYEVHYMAYEDLNKSLAKKMNNISPSQL